MNIVFQILTKEILPVVRNNDIAVLEGKLGNVPVLSTGHSYVWTKCGYDTAILGNGYQGRTQALVNKDAIHQGRTVSLEDAMRQSCPNSW
jgi:hypothetical protein